MDSNFLDRFSKNTQISNFIKIHPVGAELFHVDGRMDEHTDMTKLIATYCNFAKVPKNCPCFYLKHPYHSVQGATEMSL
jgi:hypothetical protein